MERSKSYISYICAYNDYMNASNNSLKDNPDNKFIRPSSPYSGVYPEEEFKKINKLYKIAAKKYDIVYKEFYGEFSPINFNIK